MKQHLDQLVFQRFHDKLVRKTNNFGNITWLGQPVWQNVLDLWTIQETLFEVKPDLLIECGTNRAGSAMFYAQLFDLMGKGRIVTVDVEKLHSATHPRVEFLLGSSVAEPILQIMQQRVAASPGPVMVILDSDHSMKHVRAELEAYACFVTVGSYCMVQDGVIDTLKRFRRGRPGPLPAIEDFLRGRTDFVVDQERCDRFLITHHPKGWLKRVR